ncbi:peptidoglycan-binding domain-containing protein [Pseudoalteromonas gelatinilytica]
MKIFSVLFLGVMLCGCANQLIDVPEVPPEVSAEFPTELPSSTITSFSNALVCMDDMLAVNRRAPMFISSSPIGNFSGDHSISNGITEMFISAMSRISARSGSIKYVSFEPAIQNILSLQGAHPESKQFRAPDYFIRGGLTQVNKSLWSGQEGVGESIEFDPGNLIDGGTFFLLQGQEDATESVSKSASYVSLSMDLNVGFIPNLQMLSGVYSSNTLGFTNSKSDSLSVDISVHDLGISYSLSNNITKDMNSMVRSLLEVGIIEIVGKLQNLPYHRCLLNAGRNVAKEKSLMSTFLTEMSNSPDSLVKTVQQALKELEYYDGEVSGLLDINTQDAIAEYQGRMGLLQTGAIGFDTFKMLNTYTPTRDEPYASWWKSPPTIPEGASIQANGANDNKAKKSSAKPESKKG